MTTAAELFERRVAGGRALGEDAELVDAARAGCGVSTVALSGGVLQNVVLHQLLVDRLAGRGFAVLVHSRVPPNDGGISLGQAVVAAARDRAGRLG